jgi:Fe-S-cluster containining protein
MDTSEQARRLTRGAPSDREVNHPLITLVDVEIFTATFAPDCMTHACRCRDEGGSQRNDACCQHGADVLIPEKAAILRRAAEVASVMKTDWLRPAAWFDERAPEPDPDAPEGFVLRTATVDPSDESSGCVFLEHTGARGCGLHRAALLHGFDPDEIKPSVCRLYPLSWHEGRLGLSPDFDRYSCANDEGPTVYRLMRGAVGAAFGAGLVDELDRMEAELVKRRLRLLPRSATAPGR